MLVQLAIRDIVLIDRLDLDFTSGLTVLTGETGAGKSILLDAFSLALGGRGDGSLVRHGQKQGQVAAVFDIAADHAARRLLEANGLDTPDGEIILRRQQMADGRTRAFINDQPVGVQVLRALGSSLVEIHGQHDDRALTDPASHRRLLDAFGGLDGEARDVARRHAAWRHAIQALAQHRARLEKARAEGDWLRHAVDELGKLDVSVGEENDLAERRTTMMQAEKIATDLREAYDAVTGANSPVSALSGIVRRLERRGAQAPKLVDPAIKAFDAALASLDEAGTELRAALDAANFDPHELERIEERLFGLRAASRKYDVPVDDLPNLAARYGGELQALDEGEGHLAVLEQAEAAARSEFDGAARALSARREQAARALETAVATELPPLKLERARFITHVETDDQNATADGYDRVEFWAQTNPGTRPGPLMKIASGGELSRFLLALKVVLADRGSAPTLIFDEIDSGVGGAVADAIGMRLARLGEGVQVVSITHAPQVAARAAAHFLIAKEALGKDSVATRVVALDPARRREEIARMLSGAHITSEARAAADKLLQAVP